MLIRAAVLAFLVLPHAHCVASDFETLAKDLPAGSNAVLAIDVDSILTTEMARVNDWGNPNTTANRPAYLPPEADKVIVAAQVDPPNQFEQAWEAAVISLKESLPMRLVAKAEGGYVDKIRGKEAAWVPSDAYFIQFDDATMGLMYPANKQAASRWIDQQQESSPELPAYLSSMVSAVTSGPQIVMSLDTRDVMSAHRLHQRLSESEVVADAKLDIDAMVDLFLTLQQISLEVTISDKAEARAEIQFGHSVTFDADVGKAFVLAALTNLEAEIPGVDEWTFSVHGQSIVAVGEMPVPGLRRVLSFLEIPTTKFSSLKNEDTDSEGSEEDLATKSLNYFHSVDKLVADLQEHSKSRNGDSYWFDRYAKKIERLPILYVDPDLLDFGQKTAETLRVMSGSRKSANLSAGVSRSNISASSGDGYDGGYDRYGYSYHGSGYRGSSTSLASAQQRSQNAANNQFQAKATSKKIEGFRLINDATYEVRRTMTERYNVEF